MDDSIVTHRPKLRISCTIIAHNEADRIARCISSIHGFADEIVVIDSGSTDDTVAISEKLGALCFFNPWSGYGQQKRYAETRARHDWVLNLDADEWLTPDVRRELEAVLSRPIPDHIFGFEFIIKQVYPGRDKPRPFADYHRYIRLYDKTKCRFPESAVFDEVKLARVHIQTIASPVYHQSIRSIGHLWTKNRQYFQMQRSEVKKNAIVTALRMVFEPFFIFFKYYILKRHITGGWYGLKIASTIAALRTYRLALLIQGRPTDLPK